MMNWCKHGLIPSLCEYCKQQNNYDFSKITAHFNEAIALIRMDIQKLQQYRDATGLIIDEFETRIKGVEEHQQKQIAWNHSLIGRIYECEQRLKMHDEPEKKIGWFVFNCVSCDRLLGQYRPDYLRTIPNGADRAHWLCHECYEKTLGLKK